MQYIKNRGVLNLVYKKARLPMRCVNVPFLIKLLLKRAHGKVVCVVLRLALSSRITTLFRTHKPICNRAFILFFYIPYNISYH